MTMIWRCIIELDMYVQAETESEARQLAEENAVDEMANLNADITVTPIESLKRVPIYAKDSLPWGGDGVTTIAEILGEPIP